MGGKKIQKLISGKEILIRDPRVYAEKTSRLLKKLPVTDWIDRARQIILTTSALDKTA